jgi:TM2 domain-containing membrane protein YozV
MSKFCSNCGAEANLNAVVCLKCGASVSPATVTPGKSSCSRTAYVVLALLLGELGVHDFYAGYTTKGIIKLLLTILLCELIFPPFLMWLWAFIEVFIITKDAKGQPFR